MKYEKIYLQECENTQVVYEALGGMLRVLQRGTPHQSLGYRTPQEVHGEGDAALHVAQGMPGRDEGFDFNNVEEGGLGGDLSAHGFVASFSAPTIVIII